MPFRGCCGRGPAFAGRRLRLGCLSLLALAALALPARGAPPAALAVGPDVIADVVERVVPCVVHLASRAARGAAPASRSGRGWGAWQQEQELGGEGSGFLVTREGHVVTNHHVVEGAALLEATLHDGRRFSAVTVASDKTLDLAVVKLQDPGFTPPLPEGAVAVLGDSDRLRVGQVVLAIGHPWRLRSTVTAGIVSALGRRLPGGEAAPWDGLIQTDAAINPGNSGGPLVDLQGRVVGVNAAFRAGGFGLGFAIPANLVRRVRDDVLAVGRIRRSWLGLSVEPLGEDLARRLGLQAPRGLVVARVAPGGPADRARLRPGDVLLAVDGRALDDDVGLAERVRETQVGGTIKITLLAAGGARREVELMVTEEGGPRSGAPSASSSPAR